MSVVHAPVSGLLSELLEPLGLDASQLDAVSSILDQVDGWFCDRYTLTETPAGRLFELDLGLASLSTAIDIPGLAGFNVEVGLGAAAGENVISVLQERRGEWVQLAAPRLTIAVAPSLLRPLDANTTAATMSTLAAIRIHADGSVLFIPTTVLNLPPSEIVGTGLVVELNDVMLDLAGSSTPPEILAQGYGDDFRGVYARGALLHLLPSFEFDGLAGLTVEASDVAISDAGISARLRLYWALEHDGVSIGGATTIAGQIPGTDWTIGLRSLKLDLYENVPQLFQATGVIGIPLIDLLATVVLGLSYADGQVGVSVSAMLDQAATIDLGSAGQLTIGSLSLNGVLRDDPLFIDISGTCANLQLDVDILPIAVAQAELSLRHTDVTDELRMNVGGVEFGPLGVLADAELVVTDVMEANSRTRTVHVEASVDWQAIDVEAAFGLTLPAHFPQLPTSGQATASLHWVDDAAGTGTEVALRLSAEIDDVDQLWSFITAEARPEVRSFTAEFELRFASQSELDSQSSSTEASLSAAMSLRLPDLDSLASDVPGFDVIDVRSGDDEGWIEAKLKAEIDPAGEPSLSLAVSDPLIIELQLPGLPQDEPPIHIAVTEVALSLDSSTQASGAFELAGSFVLRPLTPPPDLPMAGHIDALLGAIGLGEFGGSAVLKAAFTDDRFALSIDCIFDDASIDLDLFDLIAALASPGNPEAGSEIPLSVDVGFTLKAFSISFGSLDLAQEAGRFGFEIISQFRFAALVADVALSLSTEEFSIGFPRLEFPIEMPQFPLGVDDLIPLRADPLDASSGLDSAKYAALRQQVDGRLGELTDLDDRVVREEWQLLQSQRFVLDAIFAVHGVMSGPDNERAYSSYVELTVGLIDGVLSAVHVETSLLLVLTDVMVRIPFSDPRGIALQGGGHLEGFADDDPLKPALEAVQLTLGLSSEYIFFGVESFGDPIPLPDFGRYPGGSVHLSRLRLGYGYTKNSFSVAFAGELVLPPKLIEDADSSTEIGVGVRLPAHTAVGFKLDVIPVTLGPVDFVVPLLEFDIDLRTPGMLGIASTNVCTPVWDGLELMVDGAVHVGVERFAFSPMLSFLPIPNFRLAGDLELGNAATGLTVVADDVLVLLGLATSTGVPSMVPFLADPTMPFFENLCVNLRMAGFEINFDIQRPFPSISPLAFFEIIGLISDPLMPVDPQGALARTIRVTLTDARVRFPDSALRLFPELTAISGKELNVELNLGALITAVQMVAAAVGEAAGTIESLGPPDQWLEGLTRNPPDLSPGALIALLPPEARKFRLGASFAGFEATAVLLILDGNDADALGREFALRNGETGPAEAFEPPAIGSPTSSAALFANEPNFTGPTNRTYSQADPTQSLFAGIEFQGFGVDDLHAAARPDDSTAGVVLCANVKVFEGQRFRFLGYLFEDGSYGLVTSVDIEPLVLRVAGIRAELPLAVRGRLGLEGRAKRDAGYAKIIAAGSASWAALPGLLAVAIGVDKPARFELRSDGAFLLSADAKIRLFNQPTPTLIGSIEVSNTHAFVDGSLDWSAGLWDNHPIIELAMAASGRIGPGPVFALGGQGSLRILNNDVANVRGEITERGASVAGRIETESWLGGTLGCSLTLDVEGWIDLAKTARPAFMLTGQGSLQLFEDVRIAGRGAIIGRGGAVEASLEGQLWWMDREWVGGHVTISSAGMVSLGGSTSFVLELTPSDLPGNISVASLFVKVDISGGIELDVGGGFASCELDVDWTLGVRFPGAAGQTLPLAAQHLRISHSGSLHRQLLHLQSIDLLPLPDFSVPVPVFKVTADTNFYEVDIVGFRVAIPEFLLTDPDEDTLVYTVPTGWSAGVESVPLATPFDLELRLFLEWRDGELGLLARRPGGSDRFIGFRSIFEQ